MQIVDPKTSRNNKVNDQLPRPDSVRRVAKVLRLVWLRVVAILILLALQSHLMAEAEDATTGSDTTTLTQGNALATESDSTAPGDADGAMEALLKGVPGRVVPGFNSRACGDLDYQSMSLGQPMPPKDPCSFFDDTRIYVNTHTHRLYLCDKKTTEKVYDIAIGQGGIDKHVEGDNRTPLGTYSLTPARLSPRFGIFILVGYPTKEQVASGYTGDSIGIHGPERPNQCRGLVNVQRDWTEGCMAVTNDVFVEEIAAFILKHRGVEVTIR